MTVSIKYVGKIDSVRIALTTNKEHRGQEPTGVLRVRKHTSHRMNLSMVMAPHRQVIVPSLFHS